MSSITTHILDTASGRPAAEIPVVLERKSHSAGWRVIAEGVTDANGRIKDLIHSSEAFEAGHYRLSFDTGAYFLTQGIESFFPFVTIGFVVKDAEQHYHVPLLVSPFGYTTYRGS
jgi:5-hydroxyisourate hydrolase